MTTIDVQESVYTYPTTTANSFEIVRPYFDINKEILFVDVNLYYVDPLNPKIFKLLVNTETITFDNSPPNYYFSNIIKKDEIIAYVLDSLKLKKI